MKYHYAIALFLVLIASSMQALADTFDIPRLQGITIDGKDNDWGDQGLHVTMINRWKRWSHEPALTGDACGCTVDDGPTRQRPSVLSHASPARCEHPESGTP